MEIAITLGLLVFAIVLFITEKLSVDVVTLILLVALISTGVLSPSEAFSSFGNEFLIILASIFIVTKAIEESGVLDQLSHVLAKLHRRVLRDLWYGFSHSLVFFLHL